MALEAKSHLFFAWIIGEKSSKTAEKTVETAEFPCYSGRKNTNVVSGKGRNRTERERCFRAEKNGKREILGEECRIIIYFWKIKEKFLLTLENLCGIIVKVHETFEVAADRPSLFRRRMRAGAAPRLWVNRDPRSGRGQ